MAVDQRSAVDRERDWVDSQVVTTGCLLCCWQFTGPAVEGRVAAREHRMTAHPGLPVVTPRLANRAFHRARRSELEPIAERFRSGDLAAVDDAASRMWRDWGYGSAAQCAAMLRRELHLSGLVPRQRQAARAAASCATAGCRLDAVQGGLCHEHWLADRREDP